MEEIEAAIAAAADEPEGPTIASVKYHPETGLDLFVFTLSDGRRLIYPRESLQPVARASQDQAADVRIDGLGYGVWWPQVDSGLRLESLLEGRTGDAKWMARFQEAVPVAA